MTITAKQEQGAVSPEILNSKQKVAAALFVLLGLFMANITTVVIIGLLTDFFSHPLH